MGAGYRSADATVSARGAVALTLNDTTVIETTRAVFVGVGGDLKVTMADGQSVVFKNVPGGTVLPIQITVAWASSTGASSVLGLY